MSKKLSKWQVIIGLIICGLAIVAVFLPKYSLSPKKIAKSCSSALEKSLGSLGTALLESAGGDELEKVIEDSMDDVFEEWGMKTEYSDWDIAKSSLEEYLLEKFNEEGADLKSASELSEVFEEELGEEAAKSYKTIMTSYKVIRIVSILLIVFPVIALLGILLGIFAKGKGKAAFGIANLWLLSQAFYVALAFFVFPSKLPEFLEGFTDEKNADIVGELVQNILTSLHGIGFYAGCAAIVAFYIWAIWCWISCKKVGAYAEQGGMNFNPAQPVEAMNYAAPENAMNAGYGEQPAADMSMGYEQPVEANYGGQPAADMSMGYEQPVEANYGGQPVADMSTGYEQPVEADYGGQPVADMSAGYEQPVEASNYAPQEEMTGVEPAVPEDVTEYIPQEAAVSEVQVQPGKIHGVTGTLMGADVVLEAGEQIFIGRDPSVCQLILSDTKVSRKHCMVQFNAATETYYIECYSQNGMELSGDCNLQQNQCVEVARGTTMSFSHGREVLSLD